ncbi:MAG TPA: AraD1 family protein [Kaistia sp.]|nr:AraD1 family protein [Kaistia sp.]
MRLIQFEDTAKARRVAALFDGETTHRVLDAQSVREMALDAYAAGQDLQQFSAGLATEQTVDIAELLAAGRVLSPLDHPEPSRTVVAITGLTHLGSAQSRDAMHVKLAGDDLSDSMRMFKLGLEGGKPAPGETGAQPEWAYKGDASWLVRPEGDIELPAYGEDGGEEAEVTGLYVIAADGTVLRVGFALGNEFSDHVMERRNYLYLAHSKLRQSSFGPELYVGALPGEIAGKVSILRDGKTLWSEEFLSGEDNMAHSIANLEQHHFKYSGFRRAGDVHVYYYGASILSFADSVSLAAGDVMVVDCPMFGAPLRNTLVAGPIETPRIKPL